jgi:integrase
MANKSGHRGFGSVRQLPSKRWQARYPGPDGRIYKAPQTFETKRSAEQWLSVTETQLLRGEWIDPERSRITVHDYLDSWITQRPGLRPRTVELYKWLLRKQIDPELGGVQLGNLSTSVIRQWRASRLAAGISATVIAKAYRLLRAALNTAVCEDKILPRNPCIVRGADRESADERPVISVAQVFQIAGQVPDRYRVLVLLAAFGSMRWGEVAALRRSDVAGDGSSVRIARAMVELSGRGVVFGPPKSRAGVREVAIPDALRDDVLKHLVKYVGDDPDALLFTGELSGGPVRRSNFSQRVKWTSMVIKLGMPGVHFHDLRHAGNIWASKSGTSTRDLMARMGHDDMRAALIYQRATSEADQRIAKQLSALVQAHREGTREA